MEKGIRIQKVLSEQGIASRRKAEEWIEQGKIKINGRPGALGQKINPNRDVVTIDGERVYFQKSSQKYYIMLNKPRGFVTTMNDELGRRCVAELVEDVPERVYPIGRLDKDSEGLLLFTNDGEFANLIMHPSHHVSKTNLPRHRAPGNQRCAGGPPVHRCGNRRQKDQSCPCDRIGKAAGQGGVAGCDL